MDTPEVLTLNGREYAVLRLLGRGKGGYTWLARRDGAQYALKQIHHEPCEYYQFGDKLAAELGDYERLSALGVPLPRLLDVDREGELLLKELLPGETVYQLVLRGAVEPWHWAQVRALSQSLRGAGLRTCIHSRGCRRGEGLFRQARRIFAGILCVLQENSTRHGGKRPGQTAFEAVNTGSESRLVPHQLHRPGGYTLLRGLRM